MFVAPLRVARGVQNKVLEAMAAGLPVIASPEAAAGLAAIPGRDLVVAENVEATVRETASLLRDRRRRDGLAMAALAFVAAHHRWEENLARLDGIVERVVGTPTALANSPGPVSR